jgi:hypothetical protein
MKIRIGRNFSFGATCGPIEALQGDYTRGRFCFHWDMTPFSTETKSIYIFPRAHTW